MLLSGHGGPGGDAWRRSAAVIVLATCAACVPAGADQSAAPAPSAVAAAGPGSMAHVHALAAADSPQALRLRLEELLGHHATLMARSMRGAIDGDGEFVAAAETALDKNTDEAEAAVRTVYGEEAAAGFRTLWQRHVDALQAYARALAAKDAGAQTAAKDALDAYAQDYGRTISQLTRGRLATDELAAGVRMHIDHLLRQAELYAAGDYEGAFRTEREAYSAMFASGKGLAGAAASKPSGELPAAFDSAPTRLRSALGQLLGEHAELAFDANRAVVTGSPAAVAAAHAVDGNTRDLAAAMQAALGTAGARRFSDVWGAHIDALVAFAVAVAKQDEQGQAAGRAAIDQFPHRLGALLSAVAGGKVASAPAVAELQLHDQHMLQEVTAYAAKDYRTAHEIAYAGYNHMLDIAEMLARALEGRAALSSPRGGAATGGGGTAPRGGGTVPRGGGTAPRGGGTAPRGGG
jgi:hypothetical protein